MSAAVDKFPAGWLDYFAAREQQRADRVSAVLGQMTKREQALVREVAVMANVLGMRHGSGDVWPDTAVLAATLDGCLAMSDLYPTIARLERRAARTGGA